MNQQSATDLKLKGFSREQIQKIEAENKILILHLLLVVTWMANLFEEINLGSSQGKRGGIIMERIS